MTSSLSNFLIRETKALYAEKAANLRVIEEHISQDTDSAQVGGGTLRMMPISTPDFMHIPLDFLRFFLVIIV